MTRRQRAEVILFGLQEYHGLVIPGDDEHIHMLRHIESQITCAMVYHKRTMCPQRARNAIEYQDYQDTE